MPPAMKAARWSLLFAAACGRIGFEPVGGDTHGDARDALADGAGASGDSSTMPTIPCADTNLGSALGPDVASGSTTGTGNDTVACGGDGPDVTFGWFAPATASYRIDLCASDMTFDTLLYVRDGSCTGAQLACNDDACGLGGIQSRVTVPLTAGQGIVIVVDSVFPVTGSYQLAITQL